MTDRDVIARALEPRNISRPIDPAEYGKELADEVLAYLAIAGLVIVPKALTYKQSLAGLRAGGKTDTLRDIYDAMIAAAGGDDG